jgi:hypothetical protein
MQNQSYKQVAITNLTIHLVGVSSYILPTSDGGLGVLNIDTLKDAEFKDILREVKQAAKRFRMFIDSRAGQVFDDLQIANIETFDNVAMLAEACTGLSSEEIRDVVAQCNNRKIKLKKQAKNAKNNNRNK